MTIHICVPWLCLERLRVLPTYTMYAPSVLGTSMMRLDMWHGKA